MALLEPAGQPPAHPLAAVVHPGDLDALAERRVLGLDRFECGDGRGIPDVRSRQVDDHKPRVFRVREQRRQGAPSRMP